MVNRSHSWMRAFIFGLLAISTAAAFLSAAVFFAPQTTEASLTDTGRFNAPPKLPGKGQAGSQLSKGVFLVATRVIKGHVFSKSVVLLIEYGAQGASGVIINRPTALKLSDVLPDVKGLKGRADVLYYGGPVKDKEVAAMLLRVSGGPLPGSNPVFDDIYSVLSMDALRRVVDDEGGGIKEYRVFAGYAGWGAGQLEGEVSRGGWTVVKASSSEVFSGEPDKVWQRLSRRF